jgi:hypothetical protein
MPSRAAHDAPPVMVLVETPVMAGAPRRARMACQRIAPSETHGYVLGLQEGFHPFASSFPA